MAYIFLQHRHVIVVCFITPFPAINEIGLSYLHDMIDKRDSDYNLHASFPTIQPKCNTMLYGLNSFRYKGPNIWDSLPTYIKGSYLSYRILLSY